VEKALFYFYSNFVEMRVPLSAVVTDNMTNLELFQCAEYSYWTFIYMSAYRKVWNRMSFGRIIAKKGAILPQSQWRRSRVVTWVSWPPMLELGV